jgi:Type III restriction enzyme, res subunit
VLFCQREAAETAIFLTEVAGRSHAYPDWRARLDPENASHNSGLPRMALKMATGSGKTVLMAMLIAWQTVNKVQSPELKRELTRCLRTGRAVRKPRRRSEQRQPRLRDMVNISDRPAEVADRALPGHWEGDLILGKNNRSAMAPWWNAKPASPCCCTCPVITPPPASATP